MSSGGTFLPISLRAYAESLRPKAQETPGQRPHLEHPSQWSVVFDTETTVDAGQSLRFGAYQVREGDQLYEQGLFYAPELPAEECETLSRYAQEHNLNLLSRATFVQQVLLRYGYDRRGNIIGFNLPFDISRIAIKHGPARGNMYGGFTFTLTTDRRLPTIRIKHLSRRASLISFAAPFRQRTPKNMRERGERMPKRQGFFVDAGTIGSALLSRGFSLQSLGDFLEVEHPKRSTDEHGSDLTFGYLDYAVNDVQTTWESYSKLRARYESFGLSDTPLHRIYSEASLGKAYLMAMGLKPWREVQSAVPPQLIAKILSTYFGGRSEVRIRRELRQVMLCDFLSMYPTVNTLMGLWRFVIAEGMTWRDGTDEIRALLQAVCLSDLQKQEFWKRLPALVKIKPSGDIIPVRAEYEESGSVTIGLNHLSSDLPLWLTLADCIASKLLNGHIPDIVEAIVFEPKQPQSGLKPITIAGNPAYHVDAMKEDLYKRLIELRQETKNRLEDADTHEAKDQLRTEQVALKIAANATSYGISVEVNVQEKAKKAKVRVHHANGEPYEVMTSNEEEPGRYFHPLLGTLITGAARLMLAATECLVADHGLGWSFCDTDSMAIAKPTDMDSEVFYSRVKSIASWFEALNPYAFSGSILKIEDENYSLSNKGQLEPLYCWAVSAKRYALFNLDEGGKPILRKASAHGLGHLSAPYGVNNPALSIPKPQVSLSKLGVELWQHDLWWAITSSALRGCPNQVDLGYHPSLQSPAVSRYGATTPRLLKWFDTYNKDRPYSEQVKPFGFLLSLFADRFFAFPAARVSGGRSKIPVRPVSLFDRDLQIVAEKAFDRMTGQPVGQAQLKSYRQELAQYHLKPEGKFENGSFLDTGSTRRKHVRASSFENIGKEANRWEEQFFAGLDEAAEVEYASSPAINWSPADELRLIASEVGTRHLSEQLGLTRGTLTKLMANKPTFLRKEQIACLMTVMEQVSRSSATFRLEHDLARARLVELVDQIGLTGAGKKLNADPSNLMKIVRGRRKLTRELTAKLLPSAEGHHSPASRHASLSPRANAGKSSRTVGP